MAGAVLAFCDGLAWAELGAAIPQSGGAYRYLLEAYGPHRVGRLMSFLSLWGIVTTAPLVLASGAVGFSHYSRYLYPSITTGQAKLLAMGVGLLSTLLIYRRIDGVGLSSLLFGGIVIFSALWITGEGVLNGRLDRLSIMPGAFRSTGAFWAGLGSATLFAMFDYGEYNTACFVGGEVSRPERTIPRSIIVAIAVTGVLYLTMNSAIISVLPWQEAAHSQFVATDFIFRLHGSRAASLMTILILLATLAGVFASMLGFSRVPYAAAIEGQFFGVFARVHPTRQFPTHSVLLIGAATTFSCLLDLEELIKLFSVSGALASLAVVAAPAGLRRIRPDVARPFRMWLYPLPSIVAAAGWVYIVATSGIPYIVFSLGLILIGICAFLWKSRRSGEWPWERNDQAKWVARW